MANEGIQGASGTKSEQIRTSECGEREQGTTTGGSRSRRGSWVAREKEDEVEVEQGAKLVEGPGLFKEGCESR